MITDQNKTKLLNSTTGKLFERLPLMTTSVLKSTAAINTNNINNLNNILNNENSLNISNSNVFVTMDLEQMYPGIHLTSAKSLLSAEYLKLFSFTHIIYIDKHIIDNNSEDYNINFNVKHNRNNSNNNNINSDAISTNANNNSCLDNSSIHNINNTNRTITSSSTNEILFGHNEFETLELNFGESSYLTTVLPNCYKAVKFIDKALKGNGAVLVIDCIGGHQKCITIVIGFLMYKHNKSFLTAYQLFKRFHPNIELDRFFITQLYEYEPILQVQRTQLCGNSCSRELRSALLKRKKSYEEYYGCHTSTMSTTILCDENFLSDQMDILME